MGRRAPGGAGGIGMPQSRHSTSLRWGRSPLSFTARRQSARLCRFRSRRQSGHRVGGGPIPESASPTPHPRQTATLTSSFTLGGVGRRPLAARSARCLLPNSLAARRDSTFRHVGQSSEIRPLGGGMNVAPHSRHSCSVRLALLSGLVLACSARHSVQRFVAVPLPGSKSLPQSTHT